MLAVTLNGNRQVTGVLRGFDQFMNMVLDGTVDVKNKIDIGMVVSGGLREDGGVRLVIATIWVQNGDPFSRVYAAAIFRWQASVDPVLANFLLRCCCSGGARQQHHHDRSARAHRCLGLGLHAGVRKHFGLRE